MRKLPYGIRMANYIYQVLMIFLGLVNLLLSTLESKINPLYFEIFTVVLAWLPVGWSKFLDLTKRECGSISQIPSTAPTPEIPSPQVPEDREQSALPSVV